jgi:hypothetical protein
LEVIQHNEKVKNLAPEHPALISPKRIGFYFWASFGIMEWWNIGILGIKSGYCPDLIFIGPG